MLSISASTAHGSSIVHVVNTGPVVPADQLGRLFLPFSRLHERTRHDGFGLGLALVASITTVHNGNLHASAPPTGGLDIAVHLPQRST